MDVRQCRCCGRLFPYRGKYECPACIQKTEEDFDRVRRFLLQNPNANIMDICDNCEVSEEDVLTWTRDGRLMLNSGAGGLNCEKCGKPIVTGRYCAACSQIMADTLESAKRVMQVKSSYGGYRPDSGRRSDGGGRSSPAAPTDAQRESMHIKRGAK